MSMKFQKKIMIRYVMLSVLVTLVFGIYYYTVNVNRYKENSYDNMITVSDVKLQQIDDMLQSMEQVSTYLLSNQEVLNALTDLTMAQSSYESLFFSNAGMTIRLQLNTWYFVSQFYRIIVFNKNGVVIANNNYSIMQLDQEVGYNNLPWVDAVEGTGGKNIIVPVHIDDWGKQRNPEVLSVVKEIQGLDRGFIEVQQEKTVIDEMLRQDEEFDYMLLSKDGKVLYSSTEGADAEYYQNYLTQENKYVQEVAAPTGEPVLLLEQYSDSHEVALLTISHVNVGKMAALAILPATLLILFGFLLISIWYIYFTSRQLTKPIKQLQQFMENTQLENMKEEIPEKISNDEIEALYISYKDVLQRLNESIIKESRMSTLQLQSQFDLLQAQVNPHFIYNVLNVISNRGLENDDEVVCDMCSDLAGMLRYSTNTREKYATVRDEVRYLEMYLGLLKYRYAHKLQYQIQIEEKTEDKKLPKIVLQQLVENSISHGYLTSMDIIKIDITAYENESGWFITVCDNGSGIEEQTLQEIRASFDEMRHKLNKDREHVEMEIGGMGLKNTYARLYLLYADSLAFQIEPDREQGTCITIGVNRV